VRFEGISIDEHVGVVGFSGTLGRVVHERLSQRPGVPCDEPLCNRALPDPAGADEHEDQRISGQSLAASQRAAWPRGPAAGAVSEIPDGLHQAPRLDLAEPRQRLEHRDDLHLADRLVTPRLAWQELREAE